MREIQADIPIMIHLDNGGFNEMYVEWFDEFTKRAEPFDIIGLSYYPFWHGTMEQLEFNMRDMARRSARSWLLPRLRWDSQWKIIVIARVSRWIS